MNFKIHIIYLPFGYTNSDNLLIEANQFLASNGIGNAEIRIEEVSADDELAMTVDSYFPNSIVANHSPHPNSKGIPPTGLPTTHDDLNKFLDHFQQKHPIIK